MLKKILILLLAAYVSFVSWAFFSSFPENTTAPNVNTLPELPGVMATEAETHEQALGQSIAMISIVSGWCSLDEDPAIQAVAKDTLDYVVEIGYLIHKSPKVSAKSKQEIFSTAEAYGNNLMALLSEGYTFSEQTCRFETFNEFNRLLKQVESAATEEAVYSI